MDEQVFLNESGVSVTTSRIVIDGQTFATRNVGSLALRDTNLGFAPILFFFAAACAAAASSITWAAVFGVATAYLFWQRLTQRKLVIVAGGGETIALKTNDRARAQRIHDAVASAIAAR